MTSHQKKAKCGNQFQHTQCAAVGLWMAMAISLNKSGHMIPYFLNGYSSYSSPMVTLFVGQMLAVGTVVWASHGKPQTGYLNGKKKHKNTRSKFYNQHFFRVLLTVRVPSFCRSIVPCFAAVKPSSFRQVSSMERPAAPMALMT